MPGAVISDLEVTNISRHGFWLMTSAGERFLPFDEFPWFRDAPVSHILNVEGKPPAKLSITHKYCDLRRRTCVKILESLESVVIPCRAPDSQFRVLNGGEKLQICVGLSI